MAWVKRIPHAKAGGVCQSLTFMHIDAFTKGMGMSKDEVIESMESLAAAGLQDHHIDDLGNMTVIQFHSDKLMEKKNQRRKRRKTRRPNRRKKK